MPALLLALGLACTVHSFSVGDSSRPKGDDPGDTVPDDTATDTDADTDADSDTDTDTDTITGTSPPIDYDCEAIPEFNLGDQTLSEARAWHGIAFDDGGHLVGWDGRSALIRSAYDGNRELWVPNLNGVEQMDHLTDGNLVVVDSGSRRLAQVTEDGSITTLVPGIGSAYGVVTGPDGMLYVTDGRVFRVNPSTAERTLILSPGRGWSIHSLNFNLDSTKMYLGTIGSGDVYVVDLDADLNIVSEPTLFASGVGQGWHDAVGVDACDNVYVADYVSSGLYRIDTAGVVARMVAPGGFNLYGHGLTWGNGRGGWRADALYQPQPYNGATVREVVIGIPNGDLVRTWNGDPAPW